MIVAALWSRQHIYDELDDLSRDTDGSRELDKGKGSVRIPLCPKVIVTFFAVPVPALIDTGSQITAISWDFYEYLSLHGKLTEFPVSKVVVTTAIGKKPTTIRKQRCKIHIGDEKYQSCFLVAPGLSNSVILGNDWFLSNQVIIDYKFISVLDMIHECYNEKKQETDSFLDDIRSYASGLTSLIDGERKAFIELMSNFRKLFSPKIESAKTEPYKIKIKENKMIVRKTYPISFTYRESVDKAIKDMLRAGIIEKSHSSYCNSLRIVVKNDKSVRVCLDARYINEIIEAEHESPPLINELMQKFYGVSYMSLTDLATGYWQIPLHESSRGYTAFLHNSKMYEFCRIPFGLKTAGSAFIGALNMAFGNQSEKILTVYIDDLLIATSSSIHDHLEKINLVFSILQEKNFTLKLDKSIFRQTKVNFLGYELSIEGVKPIPDRLEFIKKFSKPENKVQLQRFIGVSTYYRQFTVRHSNLLEPFRDLLKEKKI